MAVPDAKQYIVTRDGTTDLAFSGWLLASDTAGWPEIRVYKSVSGKYIIDVRNVDDSGNQLIKDVSILSSLDDLIKFFTDTYGLYSNESKKIFREASAVEPTLLKYAVEEL